jgi:tRNA pseudouridine38-40 synthase
MRHIRLLLQYDGTNYSGWQVQIDKRTVQSLVEKAVYTVTGEHPRVTGASRTDAGVHALEQAASFITGSSLEADVIRRALNANLPEDIRIIEASECPDDFHPRYSAVNKSYVYLITHSRSSSVFLKRYSWDLPYDLSGTLEKMREASGYLEGEHDFSSFRASGCGSKTAVRKILDIEVSESASIDFMTFSINAPVIKISIKGNAFLRYMVRNIVGTLVDVGRGRTTPSGIKNILESKDRGCAGITAPAHGLFLEKINY